MVLYYKIKQLSSKKLDKVLTSGYTFNHLEMKADLPSLETSRERVPPAESTCWGRAKGYHRLINAVSARYRAK